MSRRRPPPRRAALCLAAAALALLALPACDDPSAPAADQGTERETGAGTGTETGTETGTGAAPAAPDESPGGDASRTLLFGDLHVHSAWSFDAYASDVTAPPRDAYRHARGEAIEHQNGQTIQLAGPPLDFMALTDHAEYLGVPQAAGDPEHALRKQPLIETWATGGPRNRRAAWNKINKSFRDRVGLPALMQDAVVEPAWKALVDLANEQNEPGVFSAMIGFEYTTNPGGRNLHRNVLFRDANVPTRPFSAMDSGNPEDLWRWMDRARAAGQDALAIPHNANGSDGWMFARTRFDRRPIDSEWIALRSRNEPTMEVFQIKGTSETHPSLSPDDSWADFEIVARRTTWPDKASAPPGSYLRDALRRGLEIERALGANPYRLGVVASTDGHNAASPFEEDNYTGKIGNVDGDAAERLRPVPAAPGAEPVVSIITRWGAAGVAGVWAESNTRAAIFDALRRRETYGTSGTRIRVRVAASWDGAASEAGGGATELLATGDAVPMGAVLPAAPSPAAHATLHVTAQRDPRSAPLERIQVVRGWIDDGGETHERVVDIACADGAPPSPETNRCAYAAPEPDLTTCQPAADAGRAELSAAWRDPLPPSPGGTFYYVRVLEAPTCRWTTHEANRLGMPRPQGVPATLQERAVTSPVWTR